MIFRSYLPYQTTPRLQQKAGLFCTLRESSNRRCKLYEETEQQEVNDVQSDARLLYDDRKNYIANTLCNRSFHDVFYRDSSGRVVSAAIGMMFLKTSLG